MREQEDVEEKSQCRRPADITRASKDGWTRELTSPAAGRGWVTERAVREGRPLF